MGWKIYERAEEKHDVKAWSLFILLKDEQRPNCAATPFRRGHWFFGKDGGDPAGERLYNEASKEAKAEVERLNRLQDELPHQHRRP